MEANLSEVKVIRCGAAYASGGSRTERFVKLHDFPVKARREAHPDQIWHDQPTGEY
jgi:hypothetical protein